MRSLRFLSAGLLAGGAIGVGSAILAVRSHGFEASGLDLIADLTIRDHLFAWMSYGVASGLLLAWLARLSRRVAKRLAEPGRLAAARALVLCALPFLGMDLFLWLVEQDVGHAEWIHLLWNFLGLVALLAIVVFTALFSRDRFAAEVERRRVAAGDGPLPPEFLTAFLRTASAIAVVDVFFLLPIPGFALKPHDAVPFKVLFDALAFATAHLGATDGGFARRARRIALAARGVPELAAASALGLCLYLELPLAVRVAESRHTGPNVVLVVAAALRADHLGFGGYAFETSPRLDSLAERAIVFESTYASAPRSKPSLLSLFTSLHPRPERFQGRSDPWKSTPDDVVTLAEMFRNAGFRTALFNAGNPRLFPKWNLPQGFVDQYQKLRWRGEELTDLFLRKLPALAQTRFFACLYYTDTRIPFHENDYTGPIAATLPPGLLPLLGHGRIDLGAVVAMGNDRPKAHQAVIALYDAQIRYVDREIGRVLEGLLWHGLSANTLVVFTSDHGEELWDHGGFGYGASLFEEGLRVPLLLSGPGLDPARVASRVRSIDLFPTLLELSGAATGSYEPDGATLPLDGGAEAADRPVYAAIGHAGRVRQALIEGETKLLLESPGGPGEMALYDLTRDPGETENLAADRPEVANALAARIDEIAGHGAHRRASDPDVPEPGGPGEASGDPLSSFDGLAEEIEKVDPP